MLFGFTEFFSPGIIYLISKVSPITPVNNLKKLIEWRLKRLASD